MVKVETSIAIDRPVEVIFSFVTDRRNDIVWQSGLLEARQISDGPFDVGATYFQLMEFLGQKIESTYEVTAFEPNRKMGFKSISGPIPVQGEIAMEPGSNGTEVSIMFKADPGGLFKMAGPIFGRVAKQQWESNLATLKDLLED